MCINSCAVFVGPYHAFPKGTFHVRYTPPAIPQSILCFFTASPYSWFWTTRAGLNQGKTFSVPTIPVACSKDVTKSLCCTISLFHSFKTHLNPEMLDPEMDYVTSLYKAVSKQHAGALPYSAQIPPPSSTTEGDTTPMTLRTPVPTLPPCFTST